ncbi:hypothetical protein [Microbacterium sp. NPDC089696]|uniref:hypothetical protein n=1 Tax=Microbacterium sp. NPDC089696 TaxID=3364199 RepID=UPI00380F9783
MTAEQFVKQIEASNDVADMLDRLKVGLEERGWSTPAAENASTIINNTIIAKHG